MHVDFKGVHAQFLQPSIVGGKAVYQPANPDNPKLGYFPASHQIFSNNALQVALYIYNPGATFDGECSSVSHCLYLNFTNKVDGRYKLNQDPDRISFQLDLGVAKELFLFFTGVTSSFEYRAVRQGRAPKVLKGYLDQASKGAVPVLEAVTVSDGGKNSIRVEISGASEIAISTYVIAYARLLYPSITDMALTSVLSQKRSIQEIQMAMGSSISASTSATTENGRVGDPQIRACADLAAESEPSVRHKKLAKVIWAIGNQKWTKMRIDSLQAIQAEPESRLQELIEQANGGDFREWDRYL